MNNNGWTRKLIFMPQKLADLLRDTVYQCKQKGVKANESEIIRSGIERSCNEYRARAEETKTQK